jgi:hypothetical protein
MDSILKLIILSFNSKIAKSPMNVQEALWHIVEKTSFYDYHFNEKFISLIRSDPYYNGLYELINLRIQKKFNIQKDKHEEIKIDNQYKLVKLLVDYYQASELLEDDSSRNELMLELLYHDLDISVDSSHTNTLLTTICSIENYMNKPFKHNDHPIVKRYSDFISLYDLNQTKNIELIRTKTELFMCKYPNTRNSWFKFVVESMQFPKDLDKISSTVSILFPKYFQMYNDIVCFNETCACLQQLRLSKNYEYSNYEIKIPDYDEYKNYFEHCVKVIKLTFHASITRELEQYYEYLKFLLETKSKFAHKHTVSDCIILLYNMRNYSELYNMYKKYKNYIMRKLQSSYIMSVRLNLIHVILISCTLTNRNISIKEFVDIIPTNLEKYSNIVELKVIIGQIFNIVDGIKKRDQIITSMGYNIVFKTGEICMICLENINEENIETVKCLCCKKELGHIICIFKWIKSNETCPNCRSTIEQRTAIQN